MNAPGGPIARRPTLSDVGGLVASVVAPPEDGWEVPTATVATWLLAHGGIVALYGAMVAMAAGPAQLGHALVILGWLLLLSGLWARLLRVVTRGPGPLTAVGASVRLPPARATMPQELKLCLFLVATYAAFVAADAVGDGAVVGFMIVLAATTGLRVAGLDALAARHRDGGYYLSAVFSPSALAAVTALVVLVLVLFGAVARWVDPQLHEVELRVEEWLAVELDRRSQILTLIVGLAVLTPAVAVVCEGVAAVGRYEAGLRRRVVDRELQEAREDLARTIHDEILADLDGARREVPTPGVRRRLARIEGRLRALQLGQQATPATRTVRNGLRRAAREANLLGVELRIEADRATLDAEVPGPVMVLIERLALVQIGNSSAAGANAADLRVEHRRSELVVAYMDDGGGFDPALVDRTEGGLWRIRADIAETGGFLWFTRHARGTSSEARLPLGPSEP